MFRRLLLAAFLVVAAPAALQADWQAEYRNGIGAYDNKQWAQLAALMQKAIDEKAVESSQRVLIYGTRLERYMPHFYRGIALARLGRCAEARAEFDLSEKQSVIQRESEYSLLKQTREACVPPIPTASNPITSTTNTAPPPRTETTQTTTTIADKTPVLVPQPPAPVPVPVPATDTAGEAAAALAAFRRDLQMRIADAQGFLRTNAATGGSPRARDARTKLSGDVAHATRALSGNAIDHTASSALSASLQEYRLALRAMPAPPADLLRAIDAYAKGRYADVLALLNKPPNDALYRQQAVLIRAAARYSQSLLNGDRQLHNDARKDVLAFHGATPNFTLDKRLFTPRFHTFFADVVAGREPQT